MVYLDRIISLYKKNKLIFFKKLFLKSLRIIFSLPLFPFSFFIFMLILLASPIIKIRIGTLPTTRVAHFAVNVDLYLSYKKYFQKKKTLDIFFQERFVSNEYLLKIWKRKILVGNRLIFTQVYLLICFFHANNHKIPIIKTDRDIFNIHVNPIIEQNIKLSFEEESHGYEILENIGLKKNDKFVCLNVRDDNYLKTTHPDTDWSYHDYRNSNIKNYFFAAENLARRGYYVLRMGSSNKEKLISNNKRIIDYSFSKFRSDFMDIFLCSKCSFIISNSGGVDAFTKLFRKPIVWVNFVPIAWLSTFNTNYVHLFKKHFSIKLQRELNLKEIFDYGVAGNLNTETYKKKGIELVENSPQEISDAALELDDMINNKNFYNEHQESNNKLFWDIYEKKLIEYNFRNLHGKLLGRYSSKFLENNKKYLS
jgi:putative glycosyltransferase (TIGR04372 family)